MEYEQLNAMVEMLQEEGILPVFSKERKEKIKQDKKDKVERLLSYSRKAGCLQD
jgi:hypothetical protein